MLPDKRRCLRLQANSICPRRPIKVALRNDNHTPQELADKGVHTVKIPQDLWRTAVPDAASY